MPKANVKTTDRDMGYKRYIREIKKAGSKAYVKVGFPAEAKESKAEHRGSKKATVVEIAIFHEFGSKDGKRPPQRSFIRSTHDQNKRKWMQMNKRLVRKMADTKGRFSMDEALDVLGLMIQSAQQKKIQQGDPKWDALADSTIRAKTVAGKQGTTALIDTGQMVDSITYQKVMGRGRR